MNKKIKAFTLIEILVVCAIIAVLAAIVIISLDKAHSRSRDARRVSDMETITNAFHLYYSDHGTYQIPGTGYSSAGYGWINYNGATYGSTSIAQGLVDAGYVSNVISDPSGEASTAVHSYMFFFNDPAKMASAYAELENPTAGQQATISTSVFTVTGTTYTKNYASTITN